MDRSAIRSSNLVAVGWEASEEGSQEGTLEVEFKRGVVYQYDGVPQWLYQNLLFAPSPGKYFAQNIADAYEGQRIE